METYRPRLVDAALSRLLRIIGAVSIVGPRACGKTSTARQQAASSVFLTPSTDDYALAQLSPESSLEGAVPRLIDEWQNVPEIWETVRRDVDRRGARGQFILTGSVWPKDDANRHSGAGRIATLTMRTMSLFESRESTGEVSLTGLMHDEFTSAESELSVQGIVDALVRGGWPNALDLEAKDALILNRTYIHALSEREFQFVSGARRIPAQLDEFVRAYSALISQPASYRAIERRISEQGRMAPSQNFVADMHEFARRLFIVEDQPAWSPQVRSRTTALATPKRHLVDPSLACAALNLRPERLMRDPETLGLLFESMVVRDLRCYAEAADLRGVFHYRDQKARDEFDVVVEDHDGSWIGIEVKLSWNLVEKAVDNLQRVAEKMATPPRSLIVIVPSGRAIRTDSGVLVIPVGTLAP